MKNSSMVATAKPLVSLLIPTYNRADYLGDALNSALNQDYPNLEIIVHDDASTDSTLDLLSRYHDPRLKIIRTEDNHGMIGGWNYLASFAKGKYIKFLASDDLLAPNCVTELVTAAELYKHVALVTCQRNFINEEGRVIKKMGFANKSTVVNGPTHARWILTDLRENKIGEPTAVLYPRSLIKKAGIYDPKFSQFADFEYWIRLLQFGDIVYIHKPLCSFRTHSESNTTAAICDGRFISEIFALINKYYYSPCYTQAFHLTPTDYAHVRRQKFLDTLKNIKDLLIAGNLIRSITYTRKLASSLQPLSK